MSPTRILGTLALAVVLTLLVVLPGRSADLAGYARKQCMKSLNAEGLKIDDLDGCVDYVIRDLQIKKASQFNQQCDSGLTPVLVEGLGVICVKISSANAACASGESLIHLQIGDKNLPACVPSSVRLTTGVEADGWGARGGAKGVF